MPYLIHSEEAGDERVSNVTLADAVAALEAGQVDHAASIYRLLADQDSADQLSALFGLAVCHARCRQWAEAETRLLEVLERAPSHGVARAYLGSVRLDLGRFDEAQADLDAALELAPGNAVVRIKHAELLLRVGLIPQAHAELQRAARLRAPDPALREYLRSLLMTTRKEMSRSIVRHGATPAEFWRALVVRVQGMAAPTGAHRA
jgi:predicted Zn-dependent protease